MIRQVQFRPLAAWLVLCVLLSACKGKDAVAKVGKTEIAAAELHARATGKTPAETLDTIVPRALLAEGARMSGLDRDPAVKARIDSATREILAQAYLEKSLALDNAGDEVALRKRYEERKESFARKQIHVRHIVIRHAVTGESEQSARRKINEIYAELVGGGDFEAIAREKSEDPVTAAKGGELEPLTEGSVDATFFKNAAEVRRGELSKPFETALGFHIVKAIDEPQMVVPSFAELKGRLAAEVQTEAETRLLERLRTEITVKVYEDRLAEEPKVRGNP